MKKQRVSLFDLGRIPVTETQNKSGWEDSRTLWNRLKQEEADAALAPQRAKVAAAAKSQADLEAEVAAANAELTAFWSQPLDAMRSDKAIADSVSFAFGDYGLRNGAPVTDGPQVLQAFDKFLTERGIRLTNRSAFERLRRFMEVNVAHGASCSVENWFRSLERLAYLVPEFAQSVEGYTVPVVTAKAAQPAVGAAPLTEVERRKQVNDKIETADEKEALDLIDADYGRGVQAIFLRWVDECMVPKWGVDRSVLVSTRVTKFIGEVLTRNPQLNPLRPETWDFVRRCIDYAQLIRPRNSLLTQDEKTARALEDTPLTNASFERKQDIVSRLRDLGKVE